VAQRLLFDFAHAVGRSDARNFMRKMNLSFGPEGLSAGPVHFSYTGWAVVQLHDTCRPSPNDECYLYYDHPFSFESYSWSSQQVRTRVLRVACCVYVWWARFVSCADVRKCRRRRRKFRTTRCA
jgi:hypothetical protein